MDAEITLDWMGEVLKALVRWFASPKDMSDLPDAPPRFDLVGAGGIGVLRGGGWVDGTGVDGGVGGTIFAPYIPITTPVVPTVRPVRQTVYYAGDVAVQPIYDTQTIDGGGGYTTEFFVTEGDDENDVEFDTVAGNL